MSLKKYILLALLALIPVLSLTGCKTEPAEEKTTDISENAAVEMTSVPDTSEEIAEAETDSATEKTDEIQEAKPEPVLGVRITFDYSRMPTHASNQMAIWIEDGTGNLIKTVLVTDFTAGRRGYRNRDMALSSWVEAADPDNRADDEIDAISSATPSAGSLTYTWDMSDESGERVEDGRYTVKLEGTLFWESNVLYSAVLDTAAEEDELEITEVRSDPDNPENEEMIQNVRMEVIRGGD